MGLQPLPESEVALAFTSKLVPARFTKLLRHDLNLLQLPLWQKVPPLKEVELCLEHSEKLVIGPLRVARARTLSLQTIRLRPKFLQKFPRLLALSNDQATRICVLPQLVRR
jgi:hypothetical protein